MWPVERRQQLVALRGLLHDVAALNRGSHFLDNVGAAIELAQRLVGDGGDIAEQSFVEFLLEEATREATP